VRALIDRQSDLRIVGVASDYDETVAGATAAAPNVLVTDIRMPPSFNREGIDAAKEVRKRHPGTGIVILSSTTTRIRRGVARRRFRRIRLLTERQSRAGRPIDWGDSHGRHGWHRPRPVDRRIAHATGHVEQ